MNIKIIDINKEYCEIFKVIFKDYLNIEIISSSLENYQGDYDCIVSPANSFGLMDGGFDLAITNKFGEQLMKRVQGRIVEDYAGLQPVGTSFIIPTTNEQYPYLAHTPTMELPWDISRTFNVYLAMKATLLAIEDHNLICCKENKIETVLFPMFGGGCGNVNPYSIAKQMKLAYEHVYSPSSSISWESANKRIREIIECIR